MSSSGVISRVTAPDSPQFADLVRQLQVLAGQAAEEDAWPRDQLDACARAGVFEWFAARQWGGQEWRDADLLRGYLGLSQACLTTAFVLTQRTGACQRIERSQNEPLKQDLLPGLVRGSQFATVGISHLTTSRRHLEQPVLRAEETARGFVLDGYSAWVTGAGHAQHLVVGATLVDDRQILVAVPANLPGIRIPPPEKLVALSGSHTGRVVFERVLVERKWLLAGPVREVMQQGLGARTGGLQTSTLALGLARTAIEFLRNEGQSRAALNSPVDALHREWEDIATSLWAAAENRPVCSDADLRTRANSLVLRSAQAAMAAAKGAGFVQGHPAGRWCREALFFLVWSCPQPVVAANLCEFAGLET